MSWFASSKDAQGGRFEPPTSASFLNHSYASFLPHILQQQKIDRRLFFKRALQSAAVAILRRQAPQTTYRIHAHLCYPLIEPSFAQLWLQLLSLSSTTLFSYC